jgi:hypothetical protein
MEVSGTGDKILEENPNHVRLRNVPKKMEGLPEVSSFACGWSFSLFVDVHGYVYPTGSVKNERNEQFGIIPVESFPVGLKAQGPIPGHLKFLEMKWTQDLT